MHIYLGPEVHVVILKLSLLQVCDAKEIELRFII
jgi:hypothetical protein